MRNFKESETSIWTSQSQGGLMADYLRKNVPEIKNITLTNWEGPVTIATKTKSLKMSWLPVENQFLTMFGFEAERGSLATAFKDPKSVILTHSTAIALFGNADPINQPVKMAGILDGKVTAVIKDYPKTSRFAFEYLIPIELLKTNGWAFFGWSANNFQMYAELDPRADVAKVNAKIKNFYDKNEPTSKNGELFLWPLMKSRLYGKFENGVNAGGRIDTVILFGIIAAIILLIACINFMNLSTARSEKRAKEVGVRKTAGAERSSLIGQFLGESFMITVLAFILALAMVEGALPWFNTLSEKHLSLQVSQPYYWLVALAILLLTALLAGSYPAFYLSSFSPIKALKGGIKANKGASFARKTLVVLQFTFSIALVISTILIYQQIQFGKNQPLGYDQSNLMYFPMEGNFTTRWQPMREEILASGAAESAYCASAIPAAEGGSNGWGFSWKGRKSGQENQVFEFCQSTYDFLKTTGIQLKEGRDFSPKFPGDTSRGVIINEAAVKVCGFKNPIGEEISRGKERFTVIGVIKNFAYGSPYDPASPMMVNLTLNGGNATNMIVRLNAGRGASASVDKIGKIYAKYAENAPFDYKFLDQEFEKRFEAEQQQGKMAVGFGSLAILISCLGLFGLASFMAEQRTKEIGVRKVMGASVANLWGLLSKDFVILVGISFLIATPLSYYFMHNWLQKYALRIEISWLVFVLAGVLALLVTLITVSYQAIKAATVNPIKSLRTE
jgi:ABC-type antimicrobial peptide transport system permease subunit